jgi:hypothetical protein
VPRRLGTGLEISKHVGLERLQPGQLAPWASGGEVLLSGAREEAGAGEAVRHDGRLVSSADQSSAGRSDKSASRKAKGDMQEARDQTAAAGRMSVAAKSSPLNNSGAFMVLATAYDTQSPRLSLACGWIPLP